MTADTEIARYILVASVLVVAVAYYRTQRTSGGTLTAGYFVLLGVTGEWPTIIAAFVYTAATVAIMRLFVMRVAALPRLWVYGMSIVVATSLHAVLRSTPALFDLPDGLGLVFQAGLFVTPGILAYDVMHQGLRKTAIGLSTAIVATVLVSAPLFLFDVLPSRDALSFNGNIPDYLWWLGALVAVLAALALRLARGLGTGGFIGAVFIVEVFEWRTILLLLGFVIIARLLVLLAGRLVFLTPRQAFQLAFVTGALVCWTGIYWGARLGFSPAVDLNAFLLEPLLIVGLLTADLNRVSPPRVLVGAAIGSGLVAAALFAITDLPLGVAIAVEVGVATAILLLARPALVELFTTPIEVERVGRSYAVVT